MSDCSFGRACRLTDTRAFATVASNGMRRKNALWRIVYSPKQSCIARLGVIVSKRCDKRAVQRNRIKRIARETFRTRHKTAQDIIVIANPAAATADNVALRTALLSLFAVITCTTTENV